MPANLELRTIHLRRGARRRKLARMLHDLLHNLVQKFFELVVQWGELGAKGYLVVIALMALESTVFPIPSEVVIPPAAFLATQGKMNFFGVILAGTLGSWLGSAVTYWISRWVGRVVVVKWGRYFFISEAKLARAEHWVHRYEAGGIFFARLLPVIRHLISIPAGIIRMDFKMFSAMTVIGSAVWCAVLAWFGSHVLTQDMMASPDAMVTE